MDSRIPGSTGARWVFSLQAFKENIGAVLQEVGPERTLTPYSPSLSTVLPLSTHVCSPLRCFAVPSIK